MEAEDTARTVYLTKGVGAYEVAEELSNSADEWVRTRLWILDPDGIVWVAFRDPELEEESRIQAARINFYQRGKNRIDLWDYLTASGYDGTAFTYPVTQRATSIPDLLSRVWAGATGVCSTSEAQAAGDNPLGLPTD